MEKLIENLKNIFKIPELRNRILFTFAILALYRLGCHVFVPGINREAVKGFFGQDSGLLNMANMFSGGALGNAAVFALGIMPYITASIILQILQKTVPYLERLGKEGEQGRNKINRYTRYLTVGFGLAHSWGITTLLISMREQNFLTIEDPTLFRIVAMVTLTTGAIIIMWLGEKITEKGIGNGISLIIFASIVVRVPDGFRDLFRMFTTSAVPAPVLALVLLVVLATIVAVVFFEMGVRKITIQYAKRHAGDGQTVGGGTSYLPFKVNSAGVIPVIFSASILQIPSLLLTNEELMSSWAGKVLEHFRYGSPFSNLLFFVATMFFAYFYVDMLFSPKDTAENLKKHGGFIPGIRPGKETEDYIQNVLYRLTFWGGIYLSLVSIVPSVIMSGTQLHTLPTWMGGELFARFLPNMINHGTNVQLAVTLGGTSLLILVSVALDFVNQVENQLIMRKYDGFTTHSSARQSGRSRRYG